MKILSLATLLLLAACAHTETMTTDAESVEAGTHVKAQGRPIKLLASSSKLQVGSHIDKFLNPDEAKKLNGHVAVVNVVPSVDTKVCEAQTHLLGEDKGLNADVVRATISRDLPMAQARFAKEAKLENIAYISDYKSGAFGRSSGLLMEGNELLARAVFVTDKIGVVRYLQIVPEVSHLPDMEKAFAFANRLATDNQK